MDIAPPLPSTISHGDPTRPYVEMWRRKRELDELKFTIDGSHDCWSDHSKEKMKLVYPDISFYGCYTCGRYHICCAQNHPLSTADGVHGACVCPLIESDDALICTVSGRLIQRNILDSYGLLRDQLELRRDFRYMKRQPPKLDGSRNNSKGTGTTFAKTRTHKSRAENINEARRRDAEYWHTIRHSFSTPYMYEESLRRILPTQGMSESATSNLPPSSVPTSSSLPREMGTESDETSDSQCYDEIDDIYTSLLDIQDQMTGFLQSSSIDGESEVVQEDLQHDLSMMDHEIFFSGIEEHDIKSQRSHRDIEMAFTVQTEEVYWNDHFRGLRDSIRALIAPRDPRKGFWPKMERPWITQPINWLLEASSSFPEIPLLPLSIQAQLSNRGRRKQPIIPPKLLASRRARSGRRGANVLCIPPNIRQSAIHYMANRVMNAIIFECNVKLEYARLVAQTYALPVSPVAARLARLLQDNIKHRTKMLSDLFHGILRDVRRMMLLANPEGATRERCQILEVTRSVPAFLLQAALDPFIVRDNGTFNRILWGSDWWLSEANQLGCFSNIARRQGHNGPTREFLDLGYRPAQQELIVDAEELMETARKHVFTYCVDRWPESRTLPTFTLRSISENKRNLLQLLRGADIIKSALLAERF